jgi:hypothetical protein
MPTKKTTKSTKPKSTKSKKPDVITPLNIVEVQPESQPEPEPLPLPTDATLPEPLIQPEPDDSQWPTDEEMIRLAEEYENSKETEYDSNIAQLRDQADDYGDENLSQFLDIVDSRPASSIPKSSDVGKPPIPERPPTPIYMVPPEPTYTQIQVQTAKQIAAQGAEDARNRMYKSNVEVSKAQKQFEKQVDADPAVYEEKVRGCNLLMRYRKDYQIVIDHHFKKNYEPDKLTLPQINAEIGQIKMLLNGRRAPETVETGLIFFGNFVEGFARQAVGTDALNGFAEEVRVMIEGKEPKKVKVEDKDADPELKEDIKQFVIEWMEWFLQTPGQRIAGKLFMIALSKFKDNFVHSAIQGNRQHAAMPTQANMDAIRAMAQATDL